MPRAQQSKAEPAAPTLALSRFEDLIALADEKRDLRLKTALERDVRLVTFENGKMELGVEPGAPATLVNDLSRKLFEWTGQRWMVVVSAEAGAPTLHAQQQAKRAAFEDVVRANPLVHAVMNRFPGAKIVEVRKRTDAVSALPPGDEEDVPETFAGGDESAFGAQRLPDDVDDDF